ncbi:arsenate reductase [Enterococcus termitis]|nr:arsenate reductase [Enterococcus termitis]
MTEQDILFLLKLSYNGVEDIISTRSTLYKENIDLLNSLKLSELVRFITLHPALLRSPILFDHKQFITGFNEERARCFIPRHRRKVGMNDFLFTLESDYLTKQANKQTNK